MGPLSVAEEEFGCELGLGGNVFHERREGCARRVDPHLGANAGSDNSLPATLVSVDPLIV